MNNKDYLQETLELVEQIETRYLELGARLYKIKEEKLWQLQYDSYQEFLEDAHINPGHASILVSIHKTYVVDNKITFQKLGGLGYSNLYEAIPLVEKKGVDEAIIMASTLTRSEIKDEVRDEKHGAHRHVLGQERWATCEKCGKFIRV